jgi:hypothetical protein
LELAVNRLPQTGHSVVEEEKFKLKIIEMSSSVIE